MIFFTQPLAIDSGYLATSNRIFEASLIRGSKDKEGRIYSEQGTLSDKRSPHQSKLGCFPIRKLLYSALEAS